MTLLTPLRKRFLIALPLGLVAGLICSMFAMSTHISMGGAALLAGMIVTDRILIGMVIGLAGAYRKHPVFGFPIPWFVRGTCLGIFVSLPLAIGMVMGEATTWVMFLRMDETTPWMIFFATLIAGGIYGFVIDGFATKFGGEGKEIIE